MINEAVRKVLTDGGARITGINGSTRDRVMAVVQRTVIDGIARGAGPAEVANDLEDALADPSLFGEYRAELIARTETMLAYNAAALTTYTGYGVERVQAIDGDTDEECAARNGKEFTILEAAVIQDHPNGTLDWVPILGRSPVRGSAPVTVPAPRPPRAVRTPRAPKPAPPVQAVHAAPPPPATKPVSDAFQKALADLRGQSLRARTEKAVADKLDDALRTFDRTMTDGVLPDMPAVGRLTNMRSSVQGAYRRLLTGEPMDLTFRPTAKLETVFHEIAHFVDHLGLGMQRQFGSQLGFASARGNLDSLLARVFASDEQLAAMRARAEVMEPVARAIMDSRGYRNLLDALRTGQTEYWPGGPVIHLQAGQLKWIRYAIDSEEVFARAMAQYLTKRHGAAAVRELEEALYNTQIGGRNLVPLADQWEWDDFDRIDRAITDMLRELGWLL